MVFSVFGSDYESVHLSTVQIRHLCDRASNIYIQPVDIEALGLGHGTNPHDVRIQDCPFMQNGGYLFVKEPFRLYYKMSGSEFGLCAHYTDGHVSDPIRFPKVEHYKMRKLKERMDMSRTYDRSDELAVEMPFVFSRLILKIDVFCARLNAVASTDVKGARAEAGSIESFKSSWDKCHCCHYDKWAGDPLVWVVVVTKVFNHHADRELSSYYNHHPCFDSYKSYLVHFAIVRIVVALNLILASLRRLIKKVFIIEPDYKYLQYLPDKASILLILRESAKHLDETLWNRIFQFYRPSWLLSLYKRDGLYPSYAGTEGMEVVNKERWDFVLELLNSEVACKCQCCYESPSSTFREVLSVDYENSIIEIVSIIPICQHCDWALDNIFELLESDNAEIEFETNNFIANVLGISINMFEDRIRYIKEMRKDYLQERPWKLGISLFEKLGVHGT